MTINTITLQVPVNLLTDLKSLAVNEKEDPVDIITRLIKTALKEQTPPLSEPKAPTPAFQQILEQAMDLGVTDLAEQHDHYLYGVDKHSLMKITSVTVSY